MNHNEREKLIDAAENMSPDEIHQHPMAALDKLRALARELRATEKALGEATVTPTVAEGTSDEREALDYAIRCAIPTDLEYRPLWKLIRSIQDSVVAAGFRRTEVPETSGPWDSATACFGHCDKEGWYYECVSKKADAGWSKPQGEPSDAQVRAAWDSLGSSVTIHLDFENLRAALRAASEATN